MSFIENWRRKLTESKLPSSSNITKYTFIQSPASSEDDEDVESALTTTETSPEVPPLEDYQSTRSDSVEEDNPFQIEPRMLARMRDVANRRAARMVNINKTPLYPRGCSTDHLLAYNKLWAAAVTEKDPTYFQRLAEQQQPDYLYIGCSDSRVSANEIMGLCPGEVFVHRNVANIVSPADLNMLSALQYSVDHLHVRDIIVAGHYKCGGVTAALHDIQLGLADHWTSHVRDVKKHYAERLQAEVPKRHKLDALCELNVINQVSHLVDTHIVQRMWSQEPPVKNTSFASQLQEPEGSVIIHGWIYSLDDGLIRSLLTLTKDCDIAAELSEAEEMVFGRYQKTPEDIEEERKTALAKEMLEMRLAFEAEALDYKAAAAARKSAQMAKILERKSIMLQELIEEDRLRTERRHMQRKDAVGEEENGEGGSAMKR